MNPEDLKKKMRFSHPDDGVSVRNRSYRWKEPTYEIKNIRRNSEDPNASIVYYEDTGGNKYKTNAQMFINRFSDFYIESSIKYSVKLLAQVPGYDSPLPAVENENPASIPRSCPNCGYMAMGSEINSALEKGEEELKCPRCGFSINVAPDEQFLMTECEMSKLKSAINKFSQWKENIMDLSDELYYPTAPEIEDPKMHRIRELEEELGLEPMELSDLDVSADEYLAYLEDEASGLINMAKKEAQSREDLDFPPEIDLEEEKKLDALRRKKRKREKEFYDKKQKEEERIFGEDSPFLNLKAQVDEASQYQQRAEDAVRQSANIPDFAYRGETDLGNTWAITTSQHRDSEILEQSNYETIKDDMESRFPEDVSDERFDHWAVGWVDHLLVRMLDENGKVTPAGIAILEWNDKLDEYPVADADDFSEREYKEAMESIDQDIDYVLRSEGRDDLPEDARDQVFTLIREKDEEAFDRVLEDPRHTSLDPEVILDAMEDLGFLEGQEGPPEGKEPWRKNPNQRDLFKEEDEDLERESTWYSLINEGR